VHINVLRFWRWAAGLDPDREGGTHTGVGEGTRPVLGDGGTLIGARVAGVQAVVQGGKRGQGSSGSDRHFCKTCKLQRAELVLVKRDVNIPAVGSTYTSSLSSWNAQDEHCSCIYAFCNEWLGNIQPIIFMREWPLQPVVTPWPQHSEAPCCLLRRVLCLVCCWCVSSHLFFIGIQIHIWNAERKDWRWPVVVSYKPPRFYIVTFRKLSHFYSFFLRNTKKLTTYWSYHIDHMLLWYIRLQGDFTRDGQYHEEMIEAKNDVGHYFRKVTICGCSVFKIKVNGLRSNDRRPENTSHIGSVTRKTFNATQRKTHWRPKQDLWWNRTEQHAAGLVVTSSAGVVYYIIFCWQMWQSLLTLTNYWQHFRHDGSLEVQLTGTAAGGTLLLPLCSSFNLRSTISSIHSTQTCCSCCSEHIVPSSSGYISAKWHITNKTKYLVATSPR